MILSFLSRLGAHQDFTCMAEHARMTILLAPRMLHNQHSKLYTKLGIGWRDYYLLGSVNMMAVPSTSILPPTYGVIALVLANIMTYLHLSIFSSAL